MRARIGLAVLFLFGAVGLVRADEKPVDRADLDKRIVMTVYESAVIGTDVFNKGGHAECFRLYQGTLLAVVPMLDHRPKLQAYVKGQLEKAAKMRPAEGAFELRAAIDAIQSEITGKSAKKPLWDRLGGEKAVRAVVKDFIVAAASDPKVNFDRNGKFKFDDKAIKHLEQMLVELISATTGGPLKYTGKGMKEVHAGMGITDAEFDALAGVLIGVLKKYNVPQADIDELVKIVESTRKAIVEK